MRRAPCHTPGGYLLIEALAALAVLGIGLLPLATLAPLALGTVRHYETLGHATRASAELAELESPAQVLALQQAHAGARPLPQPLRLRLCDALASAGDADGGPACVAGRRLAVAGPLSAGSAHGGGAGGNAALRAVALWIRP
ncbi:MULTISPECIES: hypothetical protein [Cupriavidus]